MGEYARRRRDGVEIKTATCEDAYYVRFDQVGQLGEPMPGSFDLRDPRTQQGVRFRFPFPWEDGVEVGEFKDYEAHLGVSGYKPPEDIDHHVVQFADTDKRGLLVSLPCPNGKDALPGVTILRNGYIGDVRIVQQRPVGEELWTVLECGACGARWRTDREGAGKLVDHMLAQVERYQAEAKRYGVMIDGRAGLLTEVAIRILDGYKARVTV